MKYDSHQEVRAPKLRLDDSYTLAELRAFAVRAGFKGVTQYNNKDQILQDIYDHINVVKKGQTVPEGRTRRFIRVTNVERDLHDVAAIFGYNGRADIYDYETATGIFHRAMIDGYLSDGLVPTSDDKFVIEPLIRKYGLEDGDTVAGRYFYYPPRDQYVLADVVGINGVPVEHFRRADTALPVPASTPVSLWGDRAANAAAVLTPIKLGESLIVTHTSGFDPARTADILAGAVIETANRADVIRIDIAPAGAGEGTVMGLDLDPDFFEEAFRVAANRARTLRNEGRDVVLVVTNASAAALGTYITGLLSLLSCAGNSAAGSVTSVVTLDRCALTAAEMAAVRLAASAELAFSADDAGDFYPDAIKSRYKGAMPDKQRQAVRAYKRFAARQEPDRTAARLDVSCLDEFIDREAGA